MPNEAEKAYTNAGVQIMWGRNDARAERKGPIPSTKE